MNPTISLLSALAAAAWSVLTWQSERQKERDLKRDEMSAQFVNALIISTQELQRRLLKVLEEDELAHYRERHSSAAEPASPAAIDLLYHFSCFFAWSLLTFRFGPYTRDTRMIAILAQIGEVLESRSRFPGEAFRFTLSERVALGDSVVTRVDEPNGKPVFNAVPIFRFEDDMMNAHSMRARLFRGTAVQATVAAIDRAVGGAPLEGRERLAALQNLLVDLVCYLERQEGFRIAYGERKRACMEEAANAVITVRTRHVEVLHQTPGRVRLGVPRLRHDENYAASLEMLLESLNHVNNVRVNRNAGSVVIEYSRDCDDESFIDKLISRIEMNRVTEHHPSAEAQLAMV